MHLQNFDAKLAPNLMQIQIAQIQKINANMQLGAKKMPALKYTDV